MAKHITGDHGGLSLKNKLNTFWLPLKSLWHKSKSMPTEAELFLLICSVFPDNFGIPIQDLVMYGMGLNLFKGVHDMMGARDRVHCLIGIINDLKYPHKVIGEKIRLAYEKDGPCNQNVIKMSVGAHDLANLIASSYPLVFHRETIVEKWPMSNRNKACYGLSLVLKKINEHPVNLDCPKLALLQLQCEEDSQSIPIDFFKGMEELCVLSLDVPSLPQSLGVLRNLISFRLKVVKSEDLSSIGSLKNLKYLCISTLHLIDIPMEMGQLENLRLLDLRRMKIAYFPPGVLSRMLKLEELYFPLSFGRWGRNANEEDDDFNECESWEEDSYDGEGRISASIDEIDGGERINTSLNEIVSLSLNTMQIGVPKASILPKKSRIFKNIQEFKIVMPNNVKYEPFSKDSINKLQLTGEAYDIKESGICDLMGRADELCLTRVRNLQNVICQLEDNGFPQLKKMIISECDELEHVVDTAKKQILSEGDYLFRKLELLHLSMLSNLKEICHGKRMSFQLFRDLRQISIRFCPKLKYVFPLSIVRGSILKSMEILDCIDMEGIFYEDKEDGIPVAPCSIEQLDLHSLPKLVRLLVNKDNTTDEVHDDINESLTADKMEGSIGSSESSLINESTSILNGRGPEDKEIICAPLTSAIREEIRESVTQILPSRKKVSSIENKSVINHMKMYSAFPSRLAGKWFQNLKSLKIAFCDAVKVIFLFEENYATSKAFNSLEMLQLHGLQNLAHIWFQIPPKISAFKNLQLLVLSGCHNSYLFSTRVAKLLVQLQKIYISRCEKMEEIIIADEEDKQKDRIVFPRLKSLEFQDIPNLRTFSGWTYEIQLPLLESLKFNQCSKMKSFSYGLMSTPLLEGIEINGSLYSLTENLNATIKRVMNIPPLQIFTLVDLKIATEDFSSSNLLGEEGFSKVYAGWIGKKPFDVGTPVAIKRMKSWLSDEVLAANYEEILATRQWEVKFFEGLSHSNLVKLLGYCWEKKELLLVYEYIPRGYLYNLLHKKDPSIKPLSWGMRVKIAIGAAGGLHYLHTKKVVHRDIKSANIMVDKDYNAKVSDFGLGIWGPSSGDSPVLTMNDKAYLLYLRITYYSFGRGYVDPQCVKTDHVCAKSDVYSFGVLLLELMTGLVELDMTRPEGQEYLVKLLKPILSQEKELKDIMDSTMEGQYTSKAMLSMAELASKCIEDDHGRRPTMGEVLEQLQQIDAIKEKDEE